MRTLHLALGHREHASLLVLEMALDQLAKHPGVRFVLGAARVGRPELSYEDVDHVMLLSRLEVEDLLGAPLERRFEGRVEDQLFEPHMKLELVDKGSPAHASLVAIGRFEQRGE